MPRLPPLLLAVLATALLVAPGADANGKAAPRADARAFTKAILAFDLTRGRAVGRAERRGDARRAEAMSCIDTLRAAPAAARPDLFTFYSTSVSAGYFAEDEPIFAAWVRSLKRVRTADRRLRAARTALTRELARARSVHRLGERFCDVADLWAAGGWTAGARPTRIRLLGEVLRRRTPSTVGDLVAGGRIVARLGGEGGMLARDVLQEGVDEPDEVVVERDDPVVALLAPAS